MTSNIVHCSFEETHDLIKEGASAMKDVEYRPDVILAIAGGGLIPARLLRTELGSPTIPIYVVGVKSYLTENNDKQEEKLQIYQWIEPTVLEQWKKDKPKILLVDDIADSRKTLRLVKGRLLKDLDTGVNIFRYIIAFVIHDKCPEHAKREAMSYMDEHVRDSIGLYFACKAISTDSWMKYAWE